MLSENARARSQVSADTFKLLMRLLVAKGLLECQGEKKKRDVEEER